MNATNFNRFKGNARKPILLLGIVLNVAVAVFVGSWLLRQPSSPGAERTAKVIPVESQSASAEVSAYEYPMGP